MLLEDLLGSLTFDFTLIIELGYSKPLTLPNPAKYPILQGQGFLACDTIVVVEV